jgi:DNA-binding response OmpR family regulator
MMKKATILVIDDEIEIGELLKEFLQLKGYAVVTAANGVEALTYMKAQRPDLALIDMWMPGINGLEILRNIRAIDPSVGVIMLTGLCDEAIVRQARQDGACDYLTKPLDLRRLEHTTRSELTGTTEVQ